MWLKQFKAVYKNAFKVSASDPFYLVINLAVLLLMVLAASMPSLGPDEHLRLVRDQTHSILFICAALAGVFGLIRVVTDDLRRGAGSILMSRPLSSYVLVAGKLLGVITCVGLLFITCSAGYIWVSEITYNSQQINDLSLTFYLVAIALALITGGARQYLFSSNFILSSSLFLSLLMILGVGLRIVLANKAQFDFVGLQSLALLFLAVAAFCSTVLVFAVVADSAIVLGLGILTFLFGLISSYLSLSFLGESVGQIATYILPNWQIYWVLEALGQGKVVPAAYFGQIFLQSSFYVGMYVVLSTMLFERIEIKGN